MHVLRMLRILLPVLVVAAIAAAVVLVVSARHDLQRARNEVVQAWTPLRSLLDTRYGTLENADHLVGSTPGPLHELSAQIDSAYAHWNDLETHGGSVGAEIAAANTLEGLGRRLVNTARAAPRLRGNTAALAALGAYATAQVPPGATSFNAVVKRYEDDRTKPAHRFAARILGYDAVPTLDTSGSV